MYIKLKYDAACADCGAALPAGTRARFFRDGTIYGDACHRWRVDLGKAEVAALQAAAARVKAASVSREIPEEAAAILERLKAAHGQQITKTNYQRVVRDLNRAARLIERS